MRFKGRFLHSLFFPISKTGMNGNNVKVAIERLDRALEKGRLKHNLKLYRYTDYDEFYNLQQDGVFKNYLSTSIDAEATNHFGEGYKVIINAPESTKGIYIGEHSDFSSEKEFLVQRNAKYRVLKVDIEERTVEIELYDD